MWLAATRVSTAPGTSKHVVDRLGNSGRARQSGALVPEPDLEVGHQGGALLSAHLETLSSGAAVDDALDLEQSVDAPHRFKRDRRDHDGVLAAPRIGGDVGELEELPACMRPTECRRDRALRAAGVVRPVVAAVGIGLEDAAEAVKVTLRVRTGAVARRIVEGRRRRPAAKGPIVSDIGPNAPRHGLALGQDRHRGVVAVQALSRQDVSLDQPVQRSQGRRAGPDLIGARRDAEVDALPPIALALPVQGLMLSELLEQDGGQEVRPGKAARRDVEGCRRLRDRLAIAAAEALAHGLDHLPAARNDLAGVWTKG